jgi:hypothetical protein
MPPIVLRALLDAGHGLPSASRWHPLAAVVAGVAVLVLGQALPIAFYGVWLRFTGYAGPAPSGDAGEPDFLFVLFLTQIGLALLTLAVASWRARARDVLGLVPPPSGPRTYLEAFAAMLPLLAVVNLFAWLLNPTGFASDFYQFRNLVHGPDPALAFAAIGLGAPLWEEMLFRGFLLVPLARRLGFWPAAALVSAGWTALHLTYSPTGLAEVFLIGLFFAWLFRRTGSLWVPIVCHAVYNSALFMVLRFFL